MTEETRARRRKQANAVRVLASPQHMPFDDFKRHFAERHIILGKAEDIERVTQELFCDECSTNVNGTVTAHILHVRIDDDPLKNFWKLATMHCYGCGFEEIVPLDEPDFQHVWYQPKAEFDPWSTARDRHVVKLKQEEEMRMVAHQQKMLQQYPISAPPKDPVKQAAWYKQLRDYLKV